MRTQKEIFSQRTKPPHQAQPGAEFGGEELDRPPNIVNALSKPTPPDVVWVADSSKRTPPVSACSGSDVVALG